LKAFFNNTNKNNTSLTQQTFALHLMTSVSEVFHYPKMEKKLENRQVVEIAP